MKPAIEKMFSIPLFADLLQQKLATIWLEQRESGNRVKVRVVTKGPVDVVQVASFDLLVAAVSQVLAGRQSLDVTVNGTDIMITRIEPVGGVDYVVTIPTPSNSHKFHSEQSLII